MWSPDALAHLSGSSGPAPRSHARGGEPVRVISGPHCVQRVFTRGSCVVPACSDVVRFARSNQLRSRVTRSQVPGVLTLAEGAETLSRWLNESTKVLVGAGAGLSVAAGIDYTDEEDFARHFPALVRRSLRARCVSSCSIHPPFWRSSATQSPAIRHPQEVDQRAL